MKLQLIIRRFAGSFILASLLLAQYQSRYWLWFTVFVGFNLLQSSSTNFCPLEIVLRKMGVGKCACDGEIASLLISRMAVPVLYFMACNREPAPAILVPFQESSMPIERKASS